MFSVSPADLIAGLSGIPARYDLRRNEVGNLAIMDGDEYLGWIDLTTGEVDWLGEPDELASINRELDALHDRVEALRARFYEVKRRRGL